MIGKNPKILIVDDEPDVTVSLQTFLGRRGFMVTTTSSGKDALAIIRSSRPDLVLLDFTLPEMDGRDVLRALRTGDPDTKVIVITGHVLSSDKEKKDIFSLGISAYLNKPVVLDRLIELIYAVLGGKAPCSGEGPKVTVKRAGTRGVPAAHKLANLLGIIRNKNENFILNVREGLYKDKPDKEIIEAALCVMKESIDVVDAAVEVVQKAKKSNNG